MKSIFLAVLILPYFSFSADLTTNKYKFGAFGEITVYAKSATPQSLILFASGDGGWNQGVVDMAKSITDEKTAVAGFSTVTYLKNSDSGKKCLYPAGDLELLSKYLQKKLNFKSYDHPVLVGYSSGATLVYGSLAQAPDGTFQGALSLGFCSDIETKNIFCKGFGLTSRKLINTKGFDLDPAQRDMSTWITLHGDQDKVCALSDIQKFVSATNGAALVPLSKVGHGFSVQKNWMPQFLSGIFRIRENNKSIQIEGDLKDLPLVFYPASDAKSDTMVVFLSGDGGWAGFDKSFADAFIKDGIPVVGFNSLKYFWIAKTPEQGAEDLNRIIESLRIKWKRDKVIVVGYSFGADVAPFFISRLPASTKKLVSKVVLLAVGKTADFEFHFTDWVSDSSKGQLIAPEVSKLSQPIKVYCLYGEDEAEDSGCPGMKSKSVFVKSFSGGHHFDSETAELYKFIK